MPRALPDVERWRRQALLGAVAWAEGRGDSGSLGGRVLLLLALHLFKFYMGQRTGRVYVQEPSVSSWGSCRDRESTELLSECPALEGPAAMWLVLWRAKHGAESACRDRLVQHSCQAGLSLPRLLPEEEAGLSASQVGAGVLELRVGVA